eukprot:GDKJ01057362.1.p1 GENE.GDKJ01057362.1~~GDKJ01057362.1.p1  ORF type:complete len:250 (+),score=23.04 GDKJ01057362.1:78-827(+)
MSKYGRFVYQHQSTIGDYLKCSICCFVFTEPTTTYCGHTFCHDCITPWLKKHGNCPVCRASSAGTHRDFIATEVLRKYLVICPFKTCDWKGESSKRDDHAKTCVSNPLNMPIELRKEMEKKEKEFDGGQTLDSDEDADCKKENLSLRSMLLMKGLGDIQQPLGITGADVQKLALNAYSSSAQDKRIAKSKAKAKCGRPSKPDEEPHSSKRKKKIRNEVREPSSESDSDDCIIMSSQPEKSRKFSLDWSS